ncbi:MAG: redoxin domain-containing protein [Ardenticatenaceae bacterium]|nr:redoxin domain-containing protein [Ardenticatenaceae bacterium]
MTDSTLEPTKEKRSPMRWSNIVLWTGVLALLAVLGWGLLNSTKARPEAGQTAPDFELLFYDGYKWGEISQASLSDMRGNVVVLNFWASWCTPCRMEADLLEASWRKYKDQGVIFLGVTYADVEPNAMDFLEEFDITYPNAPDLRSLISQDYEITGVPETFFIDKEGTISYVHIVPLDERTLNGTIDQLLADG